MVRVGRPRSFRLGWLLFGLTVSVYLLSGPTFLGYDGEMMYRLTDSLALHHSIRVTDPIYHVNEPYSFYGLAISLLLLPLFALGHFLFHDGRALITLFQPAVTALTVVSLYRLLVELGCSRRRSLAIALVFAFGTLAWHYSGVLFSEPLLALLLTVSLLWLLYFSRTWQRRWLLAAGIAAAVSSLARLDSLLVIVLPLSMYALYRVVQASRVFSVRLLDLAAYTLPIVIALGVDAAYNMARYGLLLQTGYGVEGAGFFTPILKGLYGLLLSPGAGLFIYVPVLALGVAGFHGFFRAWKAEAILILGLLILRLLFYARWWAWDGGATLGPRFLVPLLPLLLVSIGFLPNDRRVRALAVVLGALSIGIEVLDQLVPYGLYYGQVVPGLALSLGVAPCAGCAPQSMAGVQAVKEVLDFDWRFSPLVGQFRLLVRGAIDPAWRSIAYVMPLTLLGITAGVVHLYRMTLRLEGKASARSW